MSKKNNVPTCQNVQPTLYANVCRDGIPFANKASMVELAQAMCKGWDKQFSVEVLPLATFNDMEKDAIQIERTGRTQHPLLSHGDFTVHLDIDGEIKKEIISVSELEAEVSILWGTQEAPGDIQFVANDGNRRHFVLPLVNAMRKRIGLKRMSDIQYHIGSYKDETERAVSNFRANSINGKAAIVITASLIKLVVKLKDDYFLSMSAIRTKLGLSNGSKQVCDYLSEIVLHMPEVGLIAGINTGKYKRLNNGLSKFVNGKAARQKEGMTLKVGQSVIGLQAYMSEDRKIEKSMPRKDMIEICDANRCSIETTVLRSVINNDLVHLGDFRAKYAQVLNAISKYDGDLDALAIAIAERSIVQATETA